MLSHDFLVGRYNVLAASQSADDVLMRWIFPTHHFDDEVDTWIIQDLIGVYGKQFAMEGARLAPIAHQDTTKLKGTADATAQKVALLNKRVGYRGTHYPHAKEANTKRRHTGRSGHKR
jgi:hypothetical protein